MDDVGQDPRVTQLLSGIARLVRDGRALAPAWWVIVVVATLLLGNFEVWWVSFGWRHLADLSRHCPRRIFSGSLPTPEMP